MKKLTLTIIAIVAITLSSQAQVRLLQVNEQTDTFTIKNFGNSMVDISSWWLCALFNYSQINTLTVESGSLQLLPDATVVISGYAVTNAASDLGLYETNSFGSASAMRDFTQWGAPGLGRESVAVEAGIWTAGDFLEIPGPFEYIGNGTQNGLGFWQIVLSTNDFDLSSLIDIYPNPSKGILNISNQSKYSLETIELYNNLGVRVLILNGSLEQNLDHLALGHYVAKINLSENKTIFKKLMIQ